MGIPLRSRLWNPLRLSCRIDWEMQAVGRLEHSCKDRNGRDLEGHHSTASASLMDNWEKRVRTCPSLMLYIFLFYSFDLIRLALENANAVRIFHVEAPATDLETFPEIYVVTRSWSRTLLSSLSCPNHIEEKLILSTHPDSTPYLSFTDLPSNLNPTPLLWLPGYLPQPLQTVQDHGATIISLPWSTIFLLTYFLLLRMPGRLSRFFFW